MPGGGGAGSMHILGTGTCHRAVPLLRNHNLGGKFQKGDLIFDTRIISLYELISKACISYKT